MATKLDPANSARREILAELYVSGGPDYSERAVKEHVTLIQRDAYRVDSYKALRKLYMESNQYDKAWCLCQALTVLNLAEPDEQRFYNKYRSDTPATAKAVMTEADWTLLTREEDEDLLTALFAGEYAGQFRVLMPALARWGLPVPLGGTSNHFPVATLRAAGGWDAFNVTEDADLGVRLARLRYRTHMLESKTVEEAPVSLRVWLRQRTRWMKGWMQTFIVHNRRSRFLLTDLGWRSFLGFELYFGAQILSPILHILFVAGLLVQLIETRQPPFMPFDLRAALALTVFVTGYGGSFAVTLVGLWRTGQHRLLAAQALLPLYWLLHSVATLRAIHQLVWRPYYWGKTTHGMTRLARRFTDLSHPAPGLQPPDRPRREGPPAASAWRRRFRIPGR